MLDQTCIVWVLFFCHLFIYFLMFSFIFQRERERDRQSMSWGGAEREADTESKVDSRLQAVSKEPDAGLEPTNREIMT